MKLRLVELQVEDNQTQKIKVKKLRRNWKNSDGILHHQGLFYVPKIIKTELITRHYDNPLVSHFGIEKMQERVARTSY